MFNLNYPNAVLLKNYLKTKRLKDFIEEENWNKIIKGIRKNDRVYLMIKERDVAARIFGGANLLIYNTKSPNAFFEKEELLLFATINNFVKWEINSK